jgi:hypothetical protein
LFVITWPILLLDSLVGFTPIHPAILFFAASTEKDPVCVILILFLICRAVAPFAVLLCDSVQEHAPITLLLLDSASFIAALALSLTQRIQRTSARFTFR